MKESELQKLIMLEASNNNMVLWRNNRGMIKDKYNKIHKFGVGPNGASDLIGFYELTITEDMIGKTLPIFTAIEVKTLKGRPSKEQLKFIDILQKRNSIADIARCADDIKRIIKEYLTRSK